LPLLPSRCCPLTSSLPPHCFSLTAFLSPHPSLRYPRAAALALQTESIDCQAHNSGDPTPPSCLEYCDPDYRDCEFKHFGWKRCQCSRCMPLYNKRKLQAGKVTSNEHAARAHKRKKLRALSQHFAPPTFDDCYFDAHTQIECDHQGDECERWCECACLMCREYSRMTLW
jgi:hypothetical protein